MSDLPCEFGPGDRRARAEANLEEEIRRLAALARQAARRAEALDRELADARKLQQEMATLAEELLPVVLELAETPWAKIPLKALQEKARGAIAKAEGRKA